MKKATFGFQADCKDGGFKAQIQYSDPTANVLIHGSVNLTSVSCVLDDSDEFGFAYVAPKLAGKPGGQGTLYWEDNGQPGPSAGDYLEIELSGAYQYSNAGTLGGGNIQAGN